MTRWDLFVWLWAPGAVVAALAATIACGLRGRRVGTGIGVVASALAIVVTVSSWSAAPESFDDLAVAGAYLLVVAPLTLVTLVAALLPARSGPRRDARRAGAQKSRSTADSTPRNSS